MNKVLYGIGWISFHFVKRVAILSLVTIVWIGSMVVASTSASVMSAIGSAATWASMTTASEVAAQVADAKAKKVKQKAKTVGSRVNRRTKRILAINTLGAAGSFAPSVIGWSLAGGFAAYEAVMICENSNDMRELQRLMGLEPEESMIGDSCESAKHIWEAMPMVVRGQVETEIGKEVDKSEPVLVLVDGKWVDINENTNPDWTNDLRGPVIVVADGPCSPHAGVFGYEERKRCEWKQRKLAEIENFFEETGEWWGNKFYEWSN
jgi:hypothetical protein